MMVATTPKCIQCNECRKLPEQLQPAANISNDHDRVAKGDLSTEESMSSAQGTTAAITSEVSPQRPSDKVNDEPRTTAHTRK
jgi:hypothetical protein